MSQKLKKTLRRILLFPLALAGLKPAFRSTPTGRIRVLILGGYGYGNTGDEAQLGANLVRWKKISPRAHLTVLSPDPAYTFDHHEVESEHASRIAFFDSDRNNHYSSSDRYFQITFWPIALRLVFNAWMMRGGMAPALATAREAYFLHLLRRSELLHISGGGFLTGMTRSRLWDTALVMILCRIMGTPYFMTGQTAGVFKGFADRMLAKLGLEGALSMSLRDPGMSAKDVAQLGISGDRVVSTYDDALFCSKASDAVIDEALQRSGITPGKRLVAVNFHYWGMDEATKVRAAKRMGELVGEVLKDPDVEVILIPMVKSDEGALLTMSQPHGERCKLLQYNYRYDLVRGVLSRAMYLVTFKHHPIIFAQGEGVPVLSISLDDYYYRKNLGAMGNFKQDRWCIHGDDFWTGAAESKLKEFQDQSPAIRGELTRMGEELRKTDGKLIEDAIRTLKL